jgi:hypothetical protein
VIMAALSRVVNRAALVGLLVQPATVLGWHRELVQKRWAAFGRRCGPGRPALDPQIQALILPMAKGNPKWGCVRVRGELLKLGYRVSATSIRKLLRKNRIGPAPLRSRQSWKSFLTAQASAIVLTDFFSVDTVFLKRLYGPLIYGAGHKACDLVRSHRFSRRDLGEPASQKRGLGAD